jgi:hypothetical protein
MAKSLRTRMPYRFLVGVILWLTLAYAASCASSDKPHLGGRIDHPVASVPSASAPPSPPHPRSTEFALPSPLVFGTPADVTPKPPVEQPLSRSEIYARNTGLTLSPLEKSIIDDCPTRSWSKHVPKGACTSDRQCGDGFCDRGHCAAIWSCFSDYGHPCRENHNCGVRPCVDGRCRSCTSESDCDWRRGLDEGESDITCQADGAIPRARECLGMIGSLPHGIRPN